MTEIKRCSDIRDIVVSLKVQTRAYAVYRTNSESLAGRMCKSWSNVYAMIVERDTNTSVSVRFITSIYDYDEIKDIKMKLPEDFDNQKHKLIFFIHYRMAFDGSPVEEYDILLSKNHQEYVISKPIEVDLPYTDTYGNGVLNLADVIITMKYLSKWDVDGFIPENADVLCTGKIHADDTVVMLKRIAGWRDEKLKGIYWFDRMYGPLADEEFQQRQMEYIG